MELERLSEHSLKHNGNTLGPLCRLSSREKSRRTLWEVGKESEVVSLLMRKRI